MVNKQRYYKSNNKCILHKVRKHWVAISVATLMLFGGGVTTASANSTTVPVKTTNVTKVDPPKEQAQTITQRASNLHQHILLNNKINKANSNNASINKQATEIQQDQSHPITNNLYGNNIKKPHRSFKISSVVQVPSKFLRQSDSDGNSDSDNSDSPIQTGMYLGLNYKYDRNTKDLEFTSGQLQNPTSDSDGSNLATFGFSDGIYPTSIKFDQGVDTSQITSAHGMFNEDPYVQSIDLNNFDSSNITDMSNMFNNDRHLQHITLGNNFDTSKVTNMYVMFANDNLQSISLPQGFNTKGVVNMKNMFANNNDLQEINIASPNTIFNDSAFMNSVSDSDINSDTWKMTLAHMYLNNSEYSDVNLGDGQSHVGQWSLTPNPLNTVSDAKAKLNAQIQLGEQRASDVRQLSDMDQQLGSEITGNLFNLKNGLAINNISDLSDSDQVAKYPIAVKKIKDNIQHESDYLKNVVNHYRDQLSNAYPLQYQISSSDSDSDTINHIYANAKDYRWTYWRMMSRTSDNFLSVDNQINTASRTIHKMDVYSEMLKAENQYLTSMNSLILSRKGILNNYVNRIEYDINHLSQFNPVPSDHHESDNPTTSKAKKIEIANANKTIDQLAQGEPTGLIGGLGTFTVSLALMITDTFAIITGHKSTDTTTFHDALPYFKFLSSDKDTIKNVSQKNHVNNLPLGSSDQNIEHTLLKDAGCTLIGWGDNQILDALTGIESLDLINLPHNKEFHFALPKSTIESIYTIGATLFSFGSGWVDNSLKEATVDLAKTPVLNVLTYATVRALHHWICSSELDQLDSSIDTGNPYLSKVFHDIRYLRKHPNWVMTDGDISNHISAFFTDLGAIGTSFLKHPYYYCR